MIQQKQTTFYKGISLFIKAVILLLSIAYIIQKLVVGNEFDLLLQELKSSKLSYVVLVFGLMFLNWGLEAMKWQYLLKPLEKITFLNALKAVFSGVTVSIFMPNRIGEFAGRIFYLEKADKIKATIKNFIGSIAQLSITLLCGLAAILIAYKFKIIKLEELNVLRTNSTYVLFFFLLAVIGGLLLVRFYGKKIVGAKADYLHAISDLKYKEWLIVLMFSFLRYAVFLFQFYIMLLAFNIQVSFLVAFVIIALLFFVSSFIPSFAATEVVTRGATAVYLFESANVDSSFVLIVSLLVWIINLALPALIGGLFVWQMKFFKTKK
jgi:uncharacterized membrane protein YbhN (UPF0104 family)